MLPYRVTLQPMETHTTENSYQYLNDLHGKVAGAIINRINFPKREAKAMTRRAALRAKLRPLLSEWDCQEVRQTVAMVLTSNGAIYRDKLTLADWRACFYASRVLLRIDRKLREDTTELATLDRIAITVTEPTKFTARRNVIARHARWLRACIRRAYQADKSRKRNACYKRAHQFLRCVISQAGNAGISNATIADCATLDGLRMAAMRFRQYCEAGEKLLQREAQREVSARNAHIPEQREAKSFDTLTYRHGKLAAA
jgi:hypothetical protein